tara:strand:- start:326 stop:2095 length:1770 start_codon:yes stop_codon:yes gene_type:complete
VPSTTVEIKGKDNTSRAFNSVNKAIGGLKTGVLAIGAAVAGATVAFGAWFNSMRDTADRIGKVSSQLAMSSETLQKWQFAAGQSGVDAEKLNKALQKLGLNLGKAGEGSKKQVEAFKALGVSFKTTDGNLKDVETILPELARKFKILGNDTRSVTIATNLFGGAGVELLNFLRAGKAGLEGYGKALEIQGGVVEDKGIRTAEQFNDRLDLLTQKFKHLFTPIVAVANEALAPFVEEAERATMSLPDLKKEIQTQINALVKQRDALKDSKKEGKGWLSMLSSGARQSTVTKKSIQSQIDALAKQRKEIEGSIKALDDQYQIEKKALTQSMKILDVKEDVIEKEEEKAEKITVVNDALHAQNKLIHMQTNALKANLVTKQDSMDKTEDMFLEEEGWLVEMEKEYKKKDFAYAQLMENRRIAEKKKEEDAKKNAIATITSLSASVKDESDELFYLYQATSIGQAIMSTHEAATKALTAGPYMGPILAGGIYLLGMANVNKIRKEKPPSQRYLGGPVSAGKQYLVGERGPELLQMGNRGGNVVPNNQLSGSTNVMINISAVDAKGIDNLLMARKNTLVGIINQSLHSQARRSI